MGSLDLLAQDLSECPKNRFLVYIFKDNVTYLFHRKDFSPKEIYEAGKDAEYEASR